MRIVGRDTLDKFAKSHADVRSWIGNWLAHTEAARWRTPQDIKNAHASASFLAGGVVIFNVKGNSYRLETLVLYNSGTVIVEWIGTHAAYSKRNS